MHQPHFRLQTGIDYAVIATNAVIDQPIARRLFYSVKAQNRILHDNDALIQLREFIDSGGYAPGDRLPSERSLIDSLGVTRNALRKSLDTLEREGVIWRHVGKGTFITKPPSHATVPDLADLSHQVTPIQMMRARLSLEPAIAREAAANASGEAVQRIISARDRTRESSCWDTYEANDDAFHRTLAKATGNVLLLSLFDHLNQVRRAVAWQQVVRQSERPPATHSSYREHDEIVDAVQRRNPSAAHAAMRGHLNSVAGRLYGDD